MEALEREWEEAAESADADRVRWEEANNAAAFIGDDGDQRTKEYVRQFAEGVAYGHAYARSSGAGQDDIRIQTESHYLSALTIITFVSIGSN